MFKKYFTTDILYGIVDRVLQVLELRSLASFNALSSTDDGSRGIIQCPSFTTHMVKLLLTVIIIVTKTKAVTIYKGC